MRKTLFLAIAASVVFLTPGHADGPPDEWELLQNDPNPFCGTTTIDFAAPQQADVGLWVWNPDSTYVVRTLTHGLLPAGYYRFDWDQRDDDGVLVPSGDYPYQLLALNPETPGILFEAWLVATVDCEPTPVQVESWGRIRSRYSNRR